MLAETYRFQLYNDATGQTVTAYKLEVLRWKIDSNNEIVYEDAVAALENDATVSDNSPENTVDQPNGTNLYMGGHGHAEFLGNASSDGQVRLVLQYSPDGGTDYAEDGVGVILASWVVTAAETYSASFEF